MEAFTNFEINSELVTAGKEIDEMQHTCLALVAKNLRGVLTREFARVDEIVQTYNHPFPSDEAGIELYAQQLGRHVKEKLSVNIKNAGYSDFRTVLGNCQQEMINNVADIVTDEEAKNRILQLADHENGLLNIDEHGEHILPEIFSLFAIQMARQTCRDTLIGMPFDPTGRDIFGVWAMFIIPFLDNDQFRLRIEDRRKEIQKKRTAKFTSDYVCNLKSFLNKTIDDMIKNLKDADFENLKTELFYEADGGYH